MRAVVQRVTFARVRVGGRTIGQIGPGLVVFAAVAQDDTDEDLKWMAEKVVNLRIFNDEEGRFDGSVQDVGGGVLAISNFTLFGDCRKGRRPSFTDAAKPCDARAQFDQFVAHLCGYEVTVETGKFQAVMSVEVMNDGPVTILLDSRRTF